jgi:hypothetical protein
MRAVVRAIDSSDVDLRAYRPADPEDDAVFITIYAGPADGPGEESFDVTVCTPKWLSRKARQSGPIIGRHLLIVEPLVIEDVERFLKEQVERLEAPDWRSLGEKLGRIGLWEFEDYRP